MGDLYDGFIHEERREKCKKGVLINIGADTVGNGNVDARAFLDREGAADNMRPCGIESRLVLLAVRIIGSSLKVERDNAVAADVIVYPAHRGHTFIFCIHA